MVCARVARLLESLVPYAIYNLDVGRAGERRVGGGRIEGVAPCAVWPRQPSRARSQILSRCGRVCTMPYIPSSPQHTSLLCTRFDTDHGDAIVHGRSHQVKVVACPPM